MVFSFVSYGKVRVKVLYLNELRASALFAAVFFEGLRAKVPSHSLKLQLDAISIFFSLSYSLNLLIGSAAADFFKLAIVIGRIDS